jgi:hypothetical protein
MVREDKRYLIKRFIFFFLIPIFLSCGGGGGGGDSIGNVSSSSHWAKIYGVDGVGEIRGYIQQTDDGGYILAGTGLPPGRYESFRFLVIKLNSEGDIVWQKYFDREDFDDEVYSVYETEDGGYIVGGVSSGDWSESFIVKLNANGSVIWQKLYELVGTLDPTKDAGYVISSGSCVFKVNSSGNFVWGRTYEGKGGGIYPMKDDGYMVMQNETEIIRNDVNSYTITYRIRLIRLDKNNSVLWARLYESDGLFNGMYGGPVYETRDGGYVLGIIENVGGDIALVKLDSGGNIIWAKAYRGIGDIVDIHSLRQTGDGGYIIGGDVEDADYCAGDSMWVLRTDPAGNVVWAKGYGEGALALGGYVIETDSGDFVVSGSMAFYQDYPHLWVLKLHPDGTISPDAPSYLGVDIDVEVEDISSFITVEDTNPSVGSCTVRVEDVLSMEVTNAGVTVTTIASD